ncbi:MAG: response regulator [Candidatus Zixiibacteriota bacterium]
MNLQYAVEKPAMALDALAKLNRQFANKPNFAELVQTLLLTFSGQFSVGSAFAYLKLPESSNNEYVYHATGRYLKNEVLHSLIWDKNDELMLLNLKHPALIAKLNQLGNANNLIRVLSESEVRIICPIVHNDVLLGFIGFGNKVTNKSYETKDLELLNTLLYSITPLIASSYQYWEVSSLNTWYLDILNNVKQGVFAFDGDFRLKKINSSGLTILDRHYRMQYDSANLVNNQIKNIFPEDIFKGWSNLFTRAIVENKRKIMDNLKVGEGDDERIYSAYICRISAANDYQSDFILTLDDVTERKNAEDALRFTKYSLDRAAIGAFYIDENARLIYVNDVACQSLEYTHDELLNMTIHEINVNSTSDNWETHWEDLKEKGYLTLESNYRTKEGKTFPVEITANYVEFKNKGFYLAFARDISEKKQAELELLKKSEMLRATLESTADGILVVDNERNVANSNARFAEMWRIPEKIMGTKDDEKLLDYVLSQLIDPSQFLDKVKKLYRSIEEDLDILNFIDGRVFERFSCPLIQNGEVTGRVWSFRDITRKIEAEKQEKLLQEKLDHAERMEAIGVMAGGVAHDLNNMLGPLVGYPELILLKLKEEDPIRKQVVKIGQSAQNAADVIQDLLTLARRGRYEMEPININDVIQKYVDSPNYIKITKENPGIIVEMNIDDKLPNIIGSTPHLLKVIMNLIVNAFDAMPEGGKLGITTCREEVKNEDGVIGKMESGIYAVLKVKDSGVGIDEKDIDRIFEPYYSKKKMGTSGSGLGLAVVYGIVKDHKAHYEIISKKGEGTEFIFHFPVTEKNIDKEMGKTEDYSGTEKILIIDDSAEQIDIANEMLSSLGYKVTAVSNGREALDYLSKNEVDMLLLDMIMEPDFDGLTTYQEIRKLKKDPKAIIISGYSKTDRVRETLKLGAATFIKKPFTLDQLGSAIRNELNAKYVK